MNICLCLIVKDDKGDDESHVLPRLLKSVEGVVSSIAAVLTSKDGLHGDCAKLLDNAVFARWTGDFAEMRNLAMDCAPKDADWLLLLDCDEWLENAHLLPGLLEQTKDDALVLPFPMNGQLITRVHLVRNSPRWRYTGAVHETLTDNGQPMTARFLGDPQSPTAGPYVLTLSDGARSRDPEKASKDIAVLRKNPEETRNLFYLGVMLMQNEQKEEAVEWFTKFLERPDKHPAMTYFSSLCRARLSEAYTFREAIWVNSSRPEAWGELATGCFNQQDWPKAYAYALAGLHAPVATDLAFLEPHWRQWRLADILCASLINLGWWEKALPVAQSLASNVHVPDTEKKRIANYLDILTPKP